MAHLPIGFIAIWSQTAANIPPGWTQCDGTQGTPDLRDQFLIGAGSSFAPDDSGGNVDHSHDLTPDTHFHTLPVTSDLLNGANLLDNTDDATPDGNTITPGELPPFKSLIYIMRI